MSVTIRPIPGTSTARSSACTKAGTLSNVTEVTAPFSTAQDRASGPHGASIVKRVTGSTLGTSPCSTTKRPSATVAWPHMVE